MQFATIDEIDAKFANRVKDENASRFHGAIQMCDNLFGERFKYLPPQFS
jgi:hypothetical protein